MTMQIDHNSADDSGSEYPAGRSDSSSPRSGRGGRWKKVFIGSLEIAAVVDRDGAIKYANRRALELFLRPRHVAPRRLRLADFFGNNGARDRIREALQRASSTPGRPVDAGEFEIRDGDGVPRWFHIRLTDFSADRGVRGMVLNGTEVTDAVRARRELSEKVQFFTRVFDAVPSLLFVKDGDGTFHLVNRAFADFRGTETEALIGRNERSIYRNPELVERFLAEDRHVIDSGEEKILPELRTRDSNGHNRRILTIKRPLNGASGRPEFVVGIGIDVTLLREAEEENARLACIPRESPHPILAADSEGEIIYANPAAMKLMEGIGGLEEVLPERHAAIVEGVLKSGDNEGGLTVEANGREFRWLYHPLQLHGVVHIHGEETTERTRSEQSLREAERRLQTAQRLEAVGRLASGIAHDFNNVLTVIMGFASLARIQTREDAHILPHLEQVRRAAEKAAAMTRRLLLFGKRQPSEPRVLDPNGAVVDIEKMLQRFAGGAISFYLALDRGVGRIRMDPALFDQMLLNLVINARDAMPDGGSITVETRNVMGSDQLATGVGAEPGREYVMISVCDTGTGMSPETLARIFEPYFTTKPEGKGTGLGLSTVYSIVQEHSGLIGIESKLGEGTCFRIFFPRCREESADESAPRMDSTGSRHSGRNPATILVVEPEPQVRTAMAEILREGGFRVLDAVSGADAIAIAEAYTRTISVLVIDLVLPKAKGRDIARIIRSMHPETKIIYTSGQITDDGEGRDDAPDGVFVAKPFVPEELVRLIAEMATGR